MEDRPGNIISTVISDTYTVIRRPEGHLEFYENAKGLFEKRDIPDFLLTPDETEALTSFLTSAHTIPGLLISQEALIESLDNLDTAYKAIAVSPGEEWYSDPQVRTYMSVLGHVHALFPALQADHVETTEHRMVHALFKRDERVNSDKGEASQQ